MFGSLISGIGSLIGGIFGANATQQANQATIQEQNYLDTHHIQDIVGDAKAAGINPLAALGVNTPSAPVQVGATQLGEGIANAGQAIGRGVQAYGDQNSKTAQLQNELAQAQIDNVHADTTTKLATASKMAMMAQPGSPPTLGSDQGHAIPAFAWYKGKDGRPFLGISKEFAQTQFGPTSYATAPFVVPTILGENTVQAGKAIGDDFSGVAPYVRRMLSAPYQPVYGGNYP